MKTIEEEKKQAFDNAAITLAIGCMPIDESILPFELGFYAGVEFAERWIPFNEGKINEIDSSNILVKFEDGNIMRYNEDNWPMLQVTHWRPINHK